MLFIWVYFYSFNYNIFIFILCYFISILLLHFLSFDTLLVFRYSTFYLIKTLIIQIIDCFNKFTWILLYNLVSYTIFINVARFYLRFILQNKMTLNYFNKKFNFNFNFNQYYFQVIYVDEKEINWFFTFLEVLIKFNQN